MLLPAIAAVTAVAAIPAAPTAAATTPIATAPTAASATVATAPTTASRTFCLRAGFVDNEVAAAKILAVKTIDSTIGFFIVGNFDEGETAGLTREAIANQANCGSSDTQLTQPFLQLLFRCAERKITDVKLLHLELLLPGTETSSRGAHRRDLRRQRGKPEVVPRAGGRPVVPCMVSKNDWICNLIIWREGDLTGTRWTRCGVSRVGEEWYRMRGQSCYGGN